MFFFTQTVFKIITLFFFFLLLPLPLSAEKKSIGDLKKKAADVKKQVDQKENRLKDVRDREMKIIDELDRTDRSMHTVRKKEEITRSRLTLLEKKLADVRIRQTELREKMKEGERFAARRAGSLYKLGNLGRMHLLASADSLMDFYRRKKALESILRHDENLLADLKEQKEKLRKVTAELESRKKQYRETEKKHQEQAEELARQKKKREQMLRSLRKEKKLAKASLNALKEAAGKLDKKIAMLRKEETRRGKKAVKKSFPADRGLLNMPVKGKIVSFFGPYKNTELNVMNYQSGIDIQAERGEPIRSAEGGEVVFAEWFKGYGNMIIIDHGDHIYTLYAHAEEIYKAKGDTVKKDEVIGTVGDSGSMKGPVLHFEVRHHGKPVDPLKWLKKG